MTKIKTEEITKRLLRSAAEGIRVLYIIENEFTDRYRVRSARLVAWDYSDPAWYFVTICVFNGNKLLGKIEKGKIVLTRKGEIVREELERTEVIRENVKIDEWIIMPNHVHILLRILFRRNIKTDRLDDVETNEIDNNVETHGNASLQLPVTKFCVIWVIIEL